MMNNRIVSILAIACVWACEVARYLQGKGKSTYNSTGALAHLLDIAQYNIISDTPAIPLNGSTNT